MFSSLKTRLIFISIFAALMSSCSSGKVATGTTEGEIKTAIDSSNWVFTVTQVMPLSGRSRQANGTYTVVYKDGKLVVSLPYFGRATSGTAAYSGHSPLDFTSDKPAVEQQETKPGEWRIQVKPDNRDVEIMDFTFYANGTAYLSVRMTSRSGINYSGNVRPLQRQ